MNKKNDKIEVIQHEPIDDDFALMPLSNVDDDEEDEDGDYEGDDSDEDVVGALSSTFIDSIEGETLFVDEVSDKEIKSLEKDMQKMKKKKALEAEHGFHYEPRCYCCNLAVDDPDIHKIFLLSKQRPGAVQKYIAEKYGKKVKWESIDTHMKEHFLPVYDEVSYKRRENLLNIKKWIKEREDSIYPNRMFAFEEMLMQKIENVFIRSQGQPIEIEMAALKMLASAGPTLLKIHDIKMQMMGINKSPEEMQKTMTEMVKSLLQKTLDKFPEDDKKRLMAAIQQQMSGGGM